MNFLGKGLRFQFYIYFNIEKDGDSMADAVISV